LKSSASGGTSIRRVAIASFVGTAIELIFGRLCFPNYDPLTATLASFGTYAVGIIARPIGAMA
jgi:hypothetical protein